MPAFPQSSEYYPQHNGSRRLRNGSQHNRMSIVEPSWCYRHHSTSSSVLTLCHLPSCGSTDMMFLKFPSGRYSACRDRSRSGRKPPHHYRRPWHPYASEYRKFLNGCCTCWWHFHPPDSSSSRCDKVCHYSNQ